MKIRILSVFSGIGVFEKAFIDVFKGNVEFTGFSEINKFSKMIYKKHYPSISDLGDILKIDIRKLDNFDGLVGGPPCQPYSIAGKRNGARDPRGNLLIMKYVEILKIKKPNFFIFENVKGLTDKKFSRYFQKIINLMEAIGYTLEIKILNASDYGTL